MSRHSYGFPSLQVLAFFHWRPCAPPGFQLPRTPKELCAEELANKSFDPQLKLHLKSNQSVIWVVEHQNGKITSVCEWNLTDWTGSCRLDYSHHPAVSEQDHRFEHYHINIVNLTRKNTSGTTEKLMRHICWHMKLFIHFGQRFRPCCMGFAWPVVLENSEHCSPSLVGSLYQKTSLQGCTVGFSRVAS